MAFKLGDLFWKIKGDTKDIDKSLKETDKKVGGLQGSFGKLGTFLKGAFVAAAVAGIAKVTKELVTAASDAEETRNKFSVVFNGIEEDALNTAQALADGYGFSNQAAQDLLGSTANIAQGIGYTKDQSLELSAQLVSLGSDITSFTNYAGGAEEATRILTKSLLGERDALQALDLKVTQAELDNLAKASGRAWNELSQQEQATLTLGVITEKSRNAIGDFARSQDSFANQSRIAQAAMQDLKAALGQAFLPIATQAVTVFGNLVSKVADFVTKTLQAWDAQRKLNKALKGEATDLESAKQAYEETEEKLANLNRQLEYQNKQMELQSQRNIPSVTNGIQNIITGLTSQIQKEETRLEQIGESIEKLSEENVIKAASVELTEGQTDATEDLVEATDDQAEATEEVAKMIQFTQGDAIVPMTEAAREMWRVYGEGAIAAGESTQQWYENLIDIDGLMTNFVESSLSGFQDLGAAIYNNADAFNTLGAIALKALSEILVALGSQLSAEAALQTVAAIKGDASAIPAAIAAGSGAAAAYTAAGAISAAANNLTSQPSPTPTPATTPSGSTGTTTPTTSGSRGSGSTYNITINNLISTGKEADIRAAVRAQAPFIVEELVNRGDI